MANIFNKNIKIKKNFINPLLPNYKECLEYFRNFLSHYDFFTTKDLVNISKYWEYYTIKKGDYIIKPGSVPNYIKFVVVGAIKYYTEDMNGKHIVGLLTEDNFCAPIKSFNQQIPSKDGAICVEDVYGLKISYANFKSLATDFPNFLHFFHHLNEEVVNYLANRLVELQSLDALERYKILLQNDPEYFNRFSLQDISSYLGIKPETLSRIRKNK